MIVTSRTDQRHLDELRAPVLEEQMLNERVFDVIDASIKCPWLEVGGLDGSESLGCDLQMTDTRRESTAAQC